MSKRFIAMFVGALAILALVAAGCGGGDSSDTGADTTSSSEQESDNGPALTKAEFIAQADEICSATNDKNTEGVESFLSDNGLDEGEEPTEEQEEELVGSVILPQIQTETEELRELAPPQGEEETVDEIFSGVEEVVAEGEEDPGSVIGSDDPFADANQKAQDFGFKVCGGN